MHLMCTENEKDAQFLPKCLLGYKKKVSKTFSNRQRTPEKPKEPPTLGNWGSQGFLTIKTSGNSDWLLTK